MLLFFISKNKNCFIYFFKDVNEIVDLDIVFDGGLK